MKLLLALMLGCLLLYGCGSDKVKEEQEAIDLGHPNDPTALRAYKGAKDAQKQIREQQKQDQDLLNQVDQKPAPRPPDGGFGTLDDARDIKQQSEQQQQESEQALEETNQ